MAEASEIDWKAEAEKVTTEWAISGMKMEHLIAAAMRRWYDDGLAAGRAEPDPATVALLCLVVAWQTDDDRGVSEGWLSETTGIDRVTLRELRDLALTAAGAFGDEKPRPPEDPKLLQTWANERSKWTSPWRVAFATAARQLLSRPIVPADIASGTRETE